ncbi:MULTISPECIES: lysine-2,3-aminomutase-like protein [Streptomyces]|uniref:Lysine-2,3-aminomutase-like protein n=1 Tax=Streptomyces morookaense TaxID=1970 RepID=A0A7Y7E694_STRMO|nr:MULTISPECIES: lysine-2,3-aminomutase-like protein [Streptomyces]MCC2275960.1 lysine-2,3-aminomutase-like protein [Streptomyces sp. ET3-23]NVK77688.1 lysine-2,3-aminomutase-like protein [Streptomyces morookaense]GHF05281.1 lysine 2,3-aminomutase [Streptomyces morookaense]
MTGRSVRTPKDLLANKLIDEADLPEIADVARRYAVSITPAMQDRIFETDDPVGRQFVPTGQELLVTPEESDDPIGDDPFTPVKGITHRYPDRVLFKPVHVCPVYCRFCFRREVVGPGDQMLRDAHLEAALDYIRAHPEVWEVIFTGGDPLIIAPVKLRPMLEALDAIEHVKVIRFHTRVPVVDPHRVTADLVDALRLTTPVWVVVHTNHSQEIGDDARAALARLVDAGIPLVSQTVLLKGVNDTPEALEELFRTLIVNRVKPYYLHHGDLAKGTGHFRTTIGEGQELMRRLRGRVSGMCQPTYVLDIPGGHGKVPIGPVYLADDAARVTDPWGEEHVYPPKPAGGQTEGQAEGQAGGQAG